MPAAVAGYKRVMEQSDKHNPRIDQAMSDHVRSFLQGQPVDARIDERFREEGPGPRPGQPSADAAPPDRQPGTSEGMDALEVARRAELATYIEGHVFPARREHLLASARHLHAPPAVVRLIEKLPENESFDHFQDAWDAIQREG